MRRHIESICLTDQPADATDRDGHDPPLCVLTVCNHAVGRAYSREGEHDTRSDVLHILLCELIQKFVSGTFLLILESPLLDPRRASIVLLPVDCDILPRLKIRNGYSCNYYRFVYKGINSIRQHYNQNHAQVKQEHGRVRI
jgi:hypothetical protein